MGKTILVPVDGSTNSFKALTEAISLAKQLGDEIRILNIQQTLKELGMATIKEAEQIIAKENVSHSTKIRTGIAAIEIISEANDPSIRYIVMAVGKGKKEDIGSVSRRVVEISTCPVILVP